MAGQTKRGIAFRQIVEQQRAWAKRHNLAVGPDDRLQSVEQNCPWFSSRMASAYDRAGGHELEPDEGRPPKFCSLYSSAALVCNMFGPFEHDLARLARLLGCSEPVTGLHFECELKTVLRGTGPTPDLLLEASSTLAWAVESKFTEPFQQREKKDPEFAESYFKKGETLWKGLTGCREMAEGIRDRDPELSFVYLDAPQLIKHALGLRRRYSGGQLILLRFDAGTEEDKNFAKEIDRFASHIDSDLAFRALTYQGLFAELRREPTTDPKHVPYLGDRYFADVAAGPSIETRRR